MASLRRGPKVPWTIFGNMATLPGLRTEEKETIAEFIRVNVPGHLCHRSAKLWGRLVHRTTGACTRQEPDYQLFLTRGNYKNVFRQIKACVAERHRRQLECRLRTRVFGGQGGRDYTTEKQWLHLRLGMSSTT